MQRRLMVALIGIGVFAACRPEISGVNRTFVMAIVGTVVDDNGAAVTGAAVDVTPVSPRQAGTIGATQVGSCFGISGGVTRVTTNAGGAFATSILGGGAPAILCLSLNVAPPPLSGLLPQTAVANSVVIGPPGIGQDTVRFRVTLRH